MTTPKEIRAAFDAAVTRNAADPNKVARLELAREFFCNPRFRTWLQDEVFKINQREVKP